MSETTIDNRIKRLESLNLSVMHKWGELMDRFNIDYYTTNSCIISNCEIHGGDNESAMNIYFNNLESNIGNFTGKWVCNTWNCHEEFTQNIIGWTQGMLSRQKLGWSGPGDKRVTHDYAEKFLNDFVGTDYISINSSGQNSSQLFTNQVNKIYNRQIDTKTFEITREEIRTKLKIPAQYYIDRGYSPEILNLYDVGLCDNPEQKMYNRIVVPIYDQDNNYVGCTGRTIFENGKPKWLHSGGFQGSEHLYNYNRAKEHIAKSGVMIIVEGIGDVLKLEQCGINNSVSIFGTAISQGQQYLINSSGALSLIILLDNDDAGINGMKKIEKNLGRLYRLYFPNISENDVGGMNKDAITSEIQPLIDKINSERTYNE